MANAWFKVKHILQLRKTRYVNPLDPSDFMETSEMVPINIRAVTKIGNEMKPTTLFVVGKEFSPEYGLQVKVATGTWAFNYNPDTAWGAPAVRLAVMMPEHNYYYKQKKGMWTKPGEPGSSEANPYIEEITEPFETKVHNWSTNSGMTFSTGFRMDKMYFPCLIGIQTNARVSNIGSNPYYQVSVISSGPTPFTPGYSNNSFSSQTEGYFGANNNVNTTIFATMISMKQNPKTKEIEYKVSPNLDEDEIKSFMIAD